MHSDVSRLAALGFVVFTALGAGEHRTGGDCTDLNFNLCFEDFDECDEVNVGDLSDLCWENAGGGAILPMEWEWYEENCLLYEEPWICHEPPNYGTPCVNYPIVECTWHH
jgi:hypothetical protein